MKKSLLISEQDSIAALLENERVVEFFVNRGELLLGDIYSATVENILPGIDAAFVNLGKDKMGFLHANDVPGQGPLKERLVPKQKLLVQITKEPTGHKGPRVSTAISLPGRFLVLVPEERGVSISRRISEARDRARLKAVVNLMKPPGVGLIIRTEAKGQGEQELFDDFEALWDRWQTVVSDGEASIGPTLIYRDQDLLFRVIRDAYSNDVTEIICDSQDGQRRAQEYLQGWAGKQTRVTAHSGDESLLVSRGVDREIEAALSDRAELPSGGHLNIEPTEALTVIDVNSGRFTSSRTQAETVRRTNLEAAQEIPRQLRLRNIGGMVIVDFIDMDSRKDQQQVLEVFQRVLEDDRAKPQIGQLSDLGLVELTRRRQGQSLRELFTAHCTTCSGHGVTPTLALGPADNRRLIVFKTKEEELASRGGRGQQRRPSNNRQSGVLRAASASNGRVMPSIEEEAPEQEQDFDETAFVPEEILAQMPDELLDSTRAGGKLAGKRNSFNESEDESEIENGDSEDLTFEVHNTQNFAPSTAAVFTQGLVEDDESTMHDNLEASISAVAEVYQDMGTRTRTASEDDEDDEEDEVQVASAAPVVEAETSLEGTSEETDEEEDLVSFASSSPYETEYDPVTGVYRLKIKPSATETEGQSGSETENQNSEAEPGAHRAHENSHNHEHSADHAQSVSHEGASHQFTGSPLSDTRFSTVHESKESEDDDSTAGARGEDEGAQLQLWQTGAAQAVGDDDKEEEDSTPPQPQESHNL